MAWEMPLLKSHMPVRRYPSLVLTALVPGRGGPLVTTVSGLPQISSATDRLTRTAFVENTLFWLMHQPTLASASAKMRTIFRKSGCASSEPPSDLGKRRRKKPASIIGRMMSSGMRRSLSIRETAGVTVDARSWAWSMSLSNSVKRTMAESGQFFWDDDVVFEF